ncbi:MAG: VanZ family protein [Chthonomonas sp.]|nr:VanZ family protein [Chthonomonas sp.]
MQKPSPLIIVVGLAFLGWLVVGWAQYDLRTFLALALAAMLTLGAGSAQSFAVATFLHGLVAYLPLVTTAFLWSAYKSSIPSAMWQPYLALAGVSVCVSLPSLVRDVSLRRSLGWFVVAGLLGLSIAYLSGARGGPDPMRNFFIQAFGLSYDAAYALTHIVRKTIHFVFYGLLAYSTMRAALAARDDLRRAVWFGVGWAMSHAIFDEWRQSFLVGRSGSVWDVALDLAGVVTIVGIFMVWRLVRPRPESR